MFCILIAFYYVATPRDDEEKLLHAYHAKAGELSDDQQVKVYGRRLHPNISLIVRNEKW